MSDIVERLRDRPTQDALESVGVCSGVLDTRLLTLGSVQLFNEAAREIERLRSERAGLIEALESFLMAYELPGNHCELEQAARVARSILSKIKEQKA